MNLLKEAAKRVRKDENKRCFELLVILALATPVRAIVAPAPKTDLLRV